MITKASELSELSVDSHDDNVAVLSSNTVGLFGHHLLLTMCVESMYRRPTTGCVNEHIYKGCDIRPKFTTQVLLTLY